MATEHDPLRNDLRNAAANETHDSNPDPITGAPGSHPIGTGAGAAGGGLAAAAAGAAIGSVVPGIGTVVGGVVGAIVGSVAGGYAGKGVAESINPTDEDAYWREQHATRVSADDPHTYDDDYAPAYRHGYESRLKHGPEKEFHEAESELSQDWERVKGKSRLGWDKAKDHTRAAWEKLGTSTGTTGTTGSSSVNAYATSGSGGSATTGTSASSASGRGTSVPESSVNVAPRTGDNSLLGNEASHPIATGLGAAGGGTAGVVAGAAIGSAIAPGPGTLVGGAIGAVVGGLTGGSVADDIAERINPAEEDKHWRSTHTTRPYYESGMTYDDDYAPAYRYGWESRGQYKGQRFEDRESDLGRNWDRVKGKSRLSWEKAKNATRDAWHKVERAIPGDADRDGR